MTAVRHPVFLLFIASALLMTSLHASAVRPFSANYHAQYMGVEANATMTLARESDDRWNYRLALRNSLANVSQSTIFDEREGQLRPLSSNDNTSFLFKKKSVQAIYDWNSNQARWLGDVKPERRGPVALESGDMDGLLINLAIVRDLATNRPLNYRMVENGRARDLAYQILGKETITVDGTRYETTKVQRTHGDKEEIAWIAAGVPAPVRILQREEGKETINLTMIDFHLD